MIFEVGRVCIKVAGRDAGNKCVVIEVIDNNYVMIDGMTRRRKCNIVHLEPLKEIIKINTGQYDHLVDFEYYRKPQKYDFSAEVG